MKILVSALEKSSNTHLKELMKHLDDSVEFCGIFSKELGNSDYDTSADTIMGFVDVLKKLRYLNKINNDMLKLSKDADIVLLMDSSGFNLPLAKKIRNLHPKKKIYYYILPQAWAWKKGRIKTLENICDKLFSILPFEIEFYQKKDKITYVGHPLLDQIKKFKHKIEPNNSIAYMPGSRKAEIKALMPLFRQLSINMPNKTHILIIPDNFDKTFIDENYGDISNFQIQTDAREVLTTVEFAYICSGTATLEASIIGTAFALVYIAKKLDFFIANFFLDIKYIGLANIMFDKISGKKFHNEYLQNEATVKNLTDEYLYCNKQKFITNSKILRDYLKYGSSENVSKQLLF